ncbi:oocyte zinc finger protein XlCOF6.1 [Drosophila mauritiana]|uniref:Oocyte zinc finger protein XlCOF6.1 n=1 Tax=Drosophila mauritiana TaxID=7226 RepID=A0A6P8L423_DROMA|nr:oocyte zinc finger protein XlCOF6.1 [Drosophila mauritiana]
MTEVQYEGAEILALLPHTYEDEELSLSTEELQFEQLNERSQHQQGGSPSFVCRRCPALFLSREELAAHRPTHRLQGGQRTPASEHACDACGRVFQKHNALVDHMNAHNDVRNYPCPECPARFVQRSNRECHLKNVHRKAYLHSCPEPGCEKRFQQRRERGQHVKTVHQKERNLVCDTCSARFSHPVNYRKHLASHGSAKSYGCPICGKLFGRPENRDVHLFVHSICKAYICSVCGADYMRRNQLIRHGLASGHHNDPIVRQKPQFSPALAAKTRRQRNAVDESQDEELQWLEGVDALDSPGYLEHSQFSHTGKMAAIFAEDENESELFN